MWSADEATEDPPRGDREDALDVRQGGEVEVGDDAFGQNVRIPADQEVGDPWRRERLDGGPHGFAGMDGCRLLGDGLPRADHAPVTIEPAEQAASGDPSERRPVDRANDEYGVDAVGAQGCRSLSHIGSSPQRTRAIRRMRLHRLRSTVLLMVDFRVVVCGGGIAAVEGILRLRRLAGDSVHITLVAPDDDLVLRPLAVREPFAAGAPRRYPLERITADTNAEWLRDTLSWVDRDSRTVHTGGGESVPYDALLVAVGGRSSPAFEHVRTFNDAQADETFKGVVQDIEGGYSKSIAFLLPEGPVWPLPLYELALMTAERADSMGIDELEISLITPEASPMAIFGAAASDAVGELLEAAGISVYPSAVAHAAGARQLLVQPQGLELQPERMVAMPRIEGPGIRGLAGAGAHGFLPIDSACRVPGTDARVHAAGDSAAYPIKHGGLGSQMADTAASAIARLAGAPVEIEPFHPVIRATLLTGKAPLYISARLVGVTGFESEVFDSPPWPADQKVMAEELGPYLTGLDEPHAGAVAGAPAG